MKHPLQHHDGLPPRRPPVEKGLSFRSFGLGVVFMALAISARLWGDPRLVWGGIIMVLLALLLFVAALALTAFAQPASWHFHLLSFALGIFVGMPISFLLVGTAEYLLHSRPPVASKMAGISKPGQPPLSTQQP